MQYEAKLKLLELETAYYNGEISRDAFQEGVLKGGGVPLIAAATDGKRMAVEGAFLEDSNPIDSQGDELFKRLFIRDSKTISYHVGTEHPVHPGRMHFDNAAAAGRLRRTIGLFGECRIKYTSKPFLSGHLAGDILCIGDCRSSLIARHILQYQIAENGEMYRNNDPIIQLRFERVYNPACLHPSDLYIAREANGVAFTSQNTLIRDWDNPQFFIQPNVNLHNRRLLSDFLLITVVPNILDLTSYGRGSRVVIFGGTHGIGTRALCLLLDDDEYLKLLLNKVKELSYWQALIEVEIKHEDGWELPARLKSENLQVHEVLIKGDVAGFWPHTSETGSKRRGRLVSGIETLSPKDIDISEVAASGSSKISACVSSSLLDIDKRRERLMSDESDDLGVSSTDQSSTVADLVDLPRFLSQMRRDSPGIARMFRYMDAGRERRAKERNANKE